MKTFIVTYGRKLVAHSILIKAESIESAREFFEHHKPDEAIFGIREANYIDETEAMIKGMPTLVFTA